jgi:Kef-type K+ transport system membrane component KefB
MVGPAVLGLVEPSDVLDVFAELGVVFILFWVGLETRLHEMREVGRVATMTGLAGVVVPFAAGMLTGLVLGESSEAAIFLGAALAATSVGITSAVLADLGMLRTRAARTVLGAAVIDDILALVLVAVAVGIAAEGGIDFGSIAITVGLALGFVAFVALGGVRLLQARPGILQAPRFAESPLLPAVILCLALAAIAAEIGLAAVIGAFLAGLIVAETKDQHPIEDEVAPLYAFFPPFFFASIGVGLTLDNLGAIAGPLVAITVIAVVSKLLGAWIGARSLGHSDARIVAAGMVPRGEVGIIIAGIAVASGVIDDELFAVVVGMSVLTTLMIAPVLRRLGEGGPGTDRPHTDPDPPPAE